MKAVKGNVIYSIDEKEKMQHVKEGFDICTDDGKIIEHGVGKTVPYEKYVEALEEIESLQEELEAFQQKNNKSSDKGKKGES